MIDNDPRVESEDEFYEDFSGWQITESELEELLIQARQVADIKLRRLVKQAQYLRWLIPNLLELIEPEAENHTIVKLSRTVVKTFGKKVE